MFWSGWGCELFNARLGSVPWHKCPQSCSRSSREDLYLVLVTFLDTVPPPKIRKRYCHLPLAGSLREALILLCFPGTWSVCEESRDWVWSLAVSLHRSCPWAVKTRGQPQAQARVSLIQLCPAWAGRGEGPKVKKATWGGGCASSDHRIKASRGCATRTACRGLDWMCVCARPHSGSVTRQAGMRWAPGPSGSARRLGKGRRAFVDGPPPFARLLSPPERPQEVVVTSL